MAASGWERVLSCSRTAICMANMGEADTNSSQFFIVGQTKEKLKEITGESVKVFMEKLLEKARGALSGATFASVHKLDFLCRRLNQIWFDFESLNMNPQLLFEYLLYDEGGQL